MLTLLALSSTSAVLRMQRLQARGQATALVLRTTARPLFGTPAPYLLLLRTLFRRSLNRTGGSRLLSLAGRSLPGGFCPRSALLPRLLLSSIPRAGFFLAVRLLTLGFFPGLLTFGFFPGLL
ncbi:MAG: hypothetical protein EGW04_01800, partial [Rothia mucilaginosa]|nr:hypothetical protein [Rothia mucilaginosa]